MSARCCANLKFPNLIAKTPSYELAKFLEPEEAEPEVVQHLSAIAYVAAEVASQPTARGDVSGRQKAAGFRIGRV